MVPKFEIVIRSFEVLSKDQFGITALRPQDIEKRYDRIDASGVCKDIVNLNAIQAGCIPVFKLLRVSDNRELPGKDKRPITIFCTHLVAVDKEHTAMHAA